MVMAVAAGGFWLTGPSPLVMTAYGTRSAPLRVSRASSAVPSVRTVVPRQSVGSSAPAGYVPLRATKARDPVMDDLADRLDSLTLSHRGCMMNPKNRGKKLKRVVIAEQLNEILEIPVVWIDHEGDVVMGDAK